jgi:hypothetical protein
MSLGETVVPALDGAKYLADLWALDQGNSPPAAVVTKSAQLEQWACDLDWKQPDPNGDGAEATIFTAEDGWCSIESQVVLFKARTMDEGKQAIAGWGVDVSQNRFANIMVGCRSKRTAGVRHYYCAAIFADLQQARSTPLVNSPLAMSSSYPMHHGVLSGARPGRSRCSTPAAAPRAARPLPVPACEW